MKEFFIENWRLLLEAALVLVSTVMFIVRKKPVKVVDTLKEIIIRILPALINSAEMTELKGEDKLTFVIERLILALKDFDYSPDVIKEYIPFAKEQVEIILSTPQKKKVR